MKLFLNGIWCIFQVLVFSCSAFADPTLKIALASRSPIKKKAVESAFRTLYPQRTLLIREFDVPSGIASQPVSKEAGLQGLKNRLKSAQSQTSESFDYWVSIENFIEKDENGAWKDVAWVDVVSQETGVETIELSQSVGIPECHVTQAKLQGSEEPTGYGVTVGKVLRDVYLASGVDLPHDDWHSHPHFGGVSRVEILKGSLISAILKSKTVSEGVR